MYQLKSDLLLEPSNSKQLIIYPVGRIAEIQWPQSLASIAALAEDNSIADELYYQRLSDKVRKEIYLCPIDFDEGDFEPLSKAVSKALSGDNRELDIVWYQHPQWNNDALIMAYSAIGDAVYRFEENKSKKSNEANISIDDAHMSAEHWRLANAIIDGRKLYKDLGNRAGNVCTPQHFEVIANELGETLPLKIKVLDEDEMRLLGMELLLAVAKGSAQPARLIQFEYRGNPESAHHIALVGKGITFDTGGISIKPGASMEAMTMDMCGAATVFGLMLALAKAEVAVNVNGYVAAAENMPSATAYKPGDVYTAMNGTTVEIKNTDAEGRLVLADALTYASDHKPSAIIDFATLTGACLVALGNHRAAIISNDDDLASSLQLSGERTRDRAWQLPNDAVYHKALKSKVADICHIGSRNAGTILAGCFLQNFIGEDISWAHFDIAGVAFGPHSGGRPSARPMNLMMSYLLQRADEG